MFKEPIDKILEAVQKKLATPAKPFAYVRMHEEIIVAIKKLRQLAETVRVVGADAGRESLKKELKYVIAAQESDLNREGECEIDDSAIVSIGCGDDNGAYVQAWVWISNDLLDPESCS